MKKKPIPKPTFMHDLKLSLVLAVILAGFSAAYLEMEPELHAPGRHVAFHALPKRISMAAAFNAVERGHKKKERPMTREAAAAVLYLFAENN